MKKKALACLLAAVMALSLAACGSGSDNKKTSEKTESQDTNTSLEATNQLIEARILLHFLRQQQREKTH